MAARWRCYCAAIPSLVTRTSFLILRHAAERGRPSNTGRLVALALPSAEVVDYALGPRPFDQARLGDLADDTWLLWPEGPPEAWPPGRPPARLVVLDGTWPQARRMRQRLGLLGRLPVLRLPEAPERARLRRPTRPDGMSTLEAVARALALLEGEAAARPLEALYEAAVAAHRPRPHGGGPVLTSRTAAP